MIEPISKAEKTKNKIKNSFIHIYKQKNFYDITVNDIVNQAAIHRSTFYVYFDNIDALLKDIEKGLLLGMGEESYKLRSINLRNDREEPIISESSLLPLMQYFYQRKEYIVPLIGPDGDIRFVNKFKKLICEDFYETLRNNHCSFGSNQEYIIQYMASGIIEIIYNWLNKNEVSIEEMALFMTNMIIFNPFLIVE